MCCFIILVDCYLQLSDLRNVERQFVTKQVARYLGPGTCFGTKSMLSCERYPANVAVAKAGVIPS